MTKRLLCGVLGLAAAWVLCLSTVAVAQPVIEPVDTSASAIDKIPEVKDAIELFRNRNFDGALKKLEEAVKKNDDLPPAQIIMAQLFAQANIPGGVRNALERAILGSKDDPEAYAILGDFALREGRVTEADLLYNKARGYLDAFKGSKKRRELLQKSVLNGLASVAEARAAALVAAPETRDQGRAEWAQAQKLLEEFLKADTKNAAVMERIARAMFQQRDAAGCYGMLKKAKEESKEMLTPEARLALYYEAYPDHKEARTWMGRALEKAPNDLKTLLVAAEWAMQTGQTDKAKLWATEALKADKSSLEGKILRGVVALFENDLGTAERFFEDASIQSPGNFAATNNLALALCEQNDSAKKRRALEYAEKNLRLNERVAEAWSTYGWVLYKNGRPDQAEQALQKAASAGSLSADTAYFLAQVMADKDKREDAKTLLKMALDTNRPFSKNQEALVLYERLAGKSYDPKDVKKETPKDAAPTIPAGEKPAPKDPKASK